jgi:hypothetical protein
MGKKSTKSFKVTFSVQGWVEQTIEVSDPKMTAEKLEKLLNEGKLVTTIQENGGLIQLKGFKQVGQIVNVDNNCEYVEYEVDDEI